MLVLLDATQAGNLSGTGVYTEQLLRWLPEVSPDLELAVLWPAEVTRPVTPPERRVSFIPGAGSGFRRLYRAQVEAPREFARGGFNLLHYPASIGNVTGRVPSIVTVHDLSFVHHPEWFRADRALYYRWAVTRSARRASRVIADSRATARDLCNLVGIAEERIDVVPLGVDEKFRPAPPSEQERVRGRYGLPGRFFLYMGTLEPRKNLVRVVDAWSTLANRLSLDLVLAGRLGWRNAPLLRTISEHPLSGRIHMPGFIDPSDQAAVYSAAEALVWPSLYEGFGLPPLEAMACGLPVVTSSASSLPETVGDAAVLVNPEDIESIAEGMRRVAEDQALRSRLVASGLLRAAAYSWRNTATHTVTTYRRVAGEA